MGLRHTSLERPFEILKLIRDGVIRSLQDVELMSSLFCRIFRRLENGLVEAGFVEVDKEGNIRTTPRLIEFTSALDLSLTQLSAYDSGSSVVCSPAFGLPSKPAVNAEVFVLMPFLKEMRPIYDDHIKSVARELSLTVARADDFFTADSIVSDIWNAINACRIVVADCTGRNANVFYEMGVAHTLGKPVVLISSAIDDIPFDVMQYRAIVYEFSPRGMREFEVALHSTLKHEISIPRSIEDLVKGHKSKSEGVMPNLLHP